MTLPDPVVDLASLDLFATTVELGSLSQAAAVHGRAQPSASKRLRTLERTLGVTLLERRPTGSTPTAHGALVAEWAGSVLDAVERLLDGVGALQARPTGRLRVAASYTIAEHLLPDWLAALRLRHPEAGVQLEVVNSTGVLARVHEGVVDLGFIESPGRPAGVSVTVVGHDELAVVCAPDHPWAQRRRPLPAADLAATPLVLREAGSGTREAFARAMAAAGLGVAEPALELGSTASVLHAVAQGAAPTVVSPLAIGRELASGELVVVPVDGLDLHRPLAAVWRPGATKGPLADALIAIARRTCPV